MTNPKALIVGIAVLILIVTGGIFAASKLSRIKVSPPIAKASPSPEGFSTLSRDVEKLQKQTVASLQSQPETGLDDNVKVGVYVDLPQTTDLVNSPLKVKGAANVYNGIVEIRVKDAKGNVLGESSATACMGKNACPFETTLTFVKSTTLLGTIEASGLDQNQQTITQTIPVTFK